MSLHPNPPEGSQVQGRLENHAAFPIAALEAVGEMREVLKEIERTSVQSAREKGASWEDLAIALGVSRQTLYQRHRNGHKPRK